MGYPQYHEERKKLDEERHILIPVKWENFMAHTVNKEDKIIVVAGDLSDPTKVEASISKIVSEPLKAVHEEVNTRMIIVLHTIVYQPNTTSIVISSKDTDVAVLLLSHSTNSRARRCS